MPLISVAEYSAKIDPTAKSSVTFFVAPGSAAPELSPAVPLPISLPAVSNELYEIVAPIPNQRPEERC